MKKLILVFPVVALMGCTTLAQMSERAFGKDCEVQVALADETVTSSFEGVVIAVENGFIEKSVAQGYILEITGLRETLKVAGSKCPIDENVAIQLVNSVNSSASKIKGDVNGL